MQRQILITNVPGSNPIAASTLLILWCSAQFLPCKFQKNIIIKYDTASYFETISPTPLRLKCPNLSTPNFTSWKTVVKNLNLNYFVHFFVQGRSVAEAWMGWLNRIGKETWMGKIMTEFKALPWSFLRGRDWEKSRKISARKADVCALLNSTVHTKDQNISDFFYRVFKNFTVRL